MTNNSLVNSQTEMKCFLIIPLLLIPEIKIGLITSIELKKIKCLVEISAHKKKSEI